MIEVLLFGLSTNRGGIETYLKKIWDNIDHSKFHFNFIDMTGEGNIPFFYEELKASGCDFYKVTPRNVSVSRNRSDLKRLFASKKFDIFHFNVNTLSYILPVKLALKYGCKVVVHSRNAGTSTRFVTNLFHNINKIKLNRLDVTRIAVSQMAGEWLFGAGGDFSVYHNGIIIDNFKFDESNRISIRKELNCTDKIVIGNVGAFLPAKNHRFMIEVFAEIHKINPNTSLWFVGDGGSRKEMEALVKEKGLQNNILFLGIRKDMNVIYAGMDLFWFPSLYEGFGNVVLEAECEGLPCLLSDCIPQDAMIADNTFSYSLDNSYKDWALKVLDASRQQKADRSICYKELDDKGYSVEDEIIRIERLYCSMLK
ncbi:MAG: glycosyltransferase [Oscillospiraceae bacterium]|nr:glycosyltransferase [Oscillospiraceae bacterium]